MNILVVYACGPRNVQAVPLKVASNCTVRTALQLSSLLNKLDDQELNQLQVSVWGRKVPVDSILRDQDRLELTRPLRVDPKVARRERFMGQGKKSAGLFSNRRPGAKAGY